MKLTQKEKAVRATKALEQVRDEMPGNKEAALAINDFIFSASTKTKALLFDIVRNV